MEHMDEKLTPDVAEETAPKGPPAGEAADKAAEAVEEAAGPERAFTQDEVNEIIQKRLAREREKVNLLAKGEFEQALLAREKAVLEKELRAEAKERFSQAGMPLAASGFLNYESEESFEASYTAMAELMGPLMRRAVRAEIDRVFRDIGGTPKKPGAANGPKEDMLRQAFAPTK